MKVFKKVFLVVSVLSNASFLQAASESTEPKPEDKPLVSEWFALGSGCRAKQNLPGNVRYEVLPSEASKPNVYRFKFHFEDYGINEKTVDKSVLKFARECAVRMSVNPPKGKKISNIVAETYVKTAKEKGTTLNNLISLKLGAIVISENLKVLTSDEVVPSSEEQVLLFPGKGSDEKFPAMNCADPKIVGVDYSFIASRSSPQLSPMSVTLGADRSLIFEITLSDC